MPDSAGNYKLVGLLAAGFLLLAAAVSCLLLLQPTAPPWRLYDVTDHLPDLHFSLVEEGGKTVSERDFAGKTVVLTFGFTGCGAQCPLTLARLKSVTQMLGEQADHMRILFVSVDPANDTPPVLRRYLQAYAPAPVRGLTGDAEAVGALAKRYRALYRPGVFDAGDVPHSTVLYIFDSAGHARLLATTENTDAELAEDLRRLVSLSPDGPRHPERSEGSRPTREILRFAQDDGRKRMLDRRMWTLGYVP